MYLKRENIEPMIGRKTKKIIKVFENISEKMKVYAVTAGLNDEKFLILL